MSLPPEITSRVLQRCRELGFALAGVAPALPSEHIDSLRAWLKAGKHGEMQYLAEHFEKRIDPAVLLPDARAVICVADRYHDATPDPELPPGRGRVARYARGDDYHKGMKKRLFTLCDDLRQEFPDASFKACVDTAPVLEREHAQRAGLGAVGKHTLLIDRGIGSYLLLGEILTSLDLVPSEPTAPDPCGTCSRCIDACPTDAITSWSVDATRCISYLTIEHRSLIDPTFHNAMDDWLFGCDICQNVCPHNQPTERSAEADLHPAYTPRHSSFDLLEVLGWSEDDRRTAFTRSSMKRARLDMIKRNALIVAGNALKHAANDALIARIVEIADDDAESSLVRETARQILSRIQMG